MVAKPHSPFPIKMSKLLKKMEKKPHIEFLCHAAEKIFKKKAGVKGYTAVTDQTFSELRRLFPNHIKREQNSSAMCYWVKNMPAHLKNSGLMDNREFRIEFLKWAIQKYGDQEIVFHFEAGDW